MSDQLNTNSDNSDETQTSRSEQIASVAVAASCVYTSYRVGRGLFHVGKNLLAKRQVEVTVTDPESGETLTGEVVTPDN